MQQKHIANHTSHYPSTLRPPSSHKWLGWKLAAMCSNARRYIVGWSCFCFLTFPLTVAFAGFAPASSNELVSITVSGTKGNEDVYVLAESDYWDDMVYRRDAADQNKATFNRSVIMWGLYEDYDLTFTNPTGGNYTAVIYGFGISESSGTFSVVLKEPTPPIVSINSPAQGQSISSWTVAVSGTANDPGPTSSGVALVEVRVNGGSWQTVTGTDNWSLSVTLNSGSNSIEARSRDGSNNYSRVASVTVVNSCSYTLNGTSANHGSEAAAGSFAVPTTGGCGWSAVPNQSWLYATSSGSGNGTVSYTVDANTSDSTRTGTITVGGQSFTVTQGGVPPAITQQPVSRVVATGATASFTVGVTGSGLFFRWYKDGAVLANNAHISGADGATLVIAGAQAADAGYYQAQIYNTSGWTNSAVVSLGVCYNVFSPASAMFAAAGGSGSVSNACGGSIVASASVYWLHITSGGSGGVSRAITYTVDANTSASTRTGTITVGGQTFTVTQAGVPPVITQQPANQVVAVGAAAYFTAGATGPSLAWQWQKDGANLAEGGHYTGVYTPTLVVNNVQPGDAGQYSVWVGNAAGWVKSSNAALTVCAYSVSAASACFGPSGGTNSVIVSHNCGYSYSANNSAPWVHILSGAAGATPGTLVYQVDANPAATARSAVLAISGQTHTVFQAGTDTWTIYWQHTNGTLAAYYMDGTNLALNGGILLTPSQIDPAWQLMAAADLNRDGRPELLWQH